MIWLTVAEIAKKRGIGRVAAYRWLQRNASQFIERRGRHVVISAENYARLKGHADFSRFERRLLDLEAVSREQTRRLNAHADALARAQRL